MAATETTLLRVTIPLTNDGCLGQNARCSRHQRAEHTRMLRAAARLATNQALWNQPLAGVPNRIGVRWTFAWGQGRRLHDDDGCIAKAKPARDGICDALEIDDKIVKTLGVEQWLTVARQSEVVAELVALE
jgi:hypothetical protein